ncbi:ECs_2282 family putative zinc-binding protein [Achromobacter pulmonis]|uniref:ECs_2282 family putative zinc-binding protein n=1 Tax=Achromobacter pulmonis TaxID=1389932 RepID=UPI003F7A8B26
MPENIVSFGCPKCGNQQFKVAAQPRSIQDFDGAICQGCGHTITENDIRQRAIDVAREAIQKALKR